MKPQKMRGDQRQFGRRRLLQHAFVRTENRKMIACVIENLSASGALLVFGGVQPPENSFQLLTGTEQGNFDCEVVHRGHYGIGVRFDLFKTTARRPG